MGTASLVILAVGASVVGLTALLWFAGRRGARRRRIERDVWAESANVLGLVQADAPAGGHRLTGIVDGFQVEVRMEPGSLKDAGTALVRSRLDGTGRLCKDLKVEAAGLFSGAHEGLGDKDFDAVVRASGPEAELMAAFGAAGRAAALPFVKEGGWLVEGGLELNTELQDSAETVVADVRRMVKLAKALSVASQKEALLENATNDPCPGVRRRSLMALTNAHAGSKEALWGAQAGLRDLDPELRLFAAQQMVGSDEARETLVKLVENRALPAKLRATALDWLAASCPYETIAPAVAWALSCEVLEVRCAAVFAVGKGKDESRLEALAAQAAQAPEEPMGLALAEAFAFLGGPRSEDALLRLLAHPASEVRKSAAKALGQAGTVRVVEPLLQSAKDGAVGSVARDAVRAIQARVGGAGAGGLSVVEHVGEEGALSLENPIPEPPERSGD